MLHPWVKKLAMFLARLKPTSLVEEEVALLLWREALGASPVQPLGLMTKRSLKVHKEICSRG